MVFKVIKYFLCLTFLISTSYSYYNYTQPYTNWGAICETGTKQSPIDFPADYASYNTTEYFKVIDVRYGKNGKGLVDKEIKAYNNFELIGNTSDWGYIIILKNGVKYKYNLNNFHTHLFSEHTFDGVNGDIELHLVHTKDYQWLKDNNIVDQDPNHNITVLATIFKSGAFSDDENMSKLRLMSESQIIRDFDIARYVPIKKPFVHYEGSLTSPNCMETVNWVVSTDLVMISNAQFVSFKNWMQTVYPAQYNNRATNPLGVRQLYYQYYPNQTINGGFTLMKFSIIFILSLLLF